MGDLAATDADAQGVSCNYRLRSFDYTRIHLGRATRTRAEDLRDSAARLLAQAAQLDARPKEPEPPFADDPTVVLIAAHYDDGATHWSVALQSANGKWHAPGLPPTTWDDLLDSASLIAESVEIWVATEWTSQGSYRG